VVNGWLSWPLRIKSKINLHAIDDFPNDVLTAMNGIYVSLVPSLNAKNYRPLSSSNAMTIFPP
jgi:hypothetical protein